MGIFKRKIHRFFVVFRSFEYQSLPSPFYMKYSYSVFNTIKCTIIFTFVCGSTIFSERTYIHTYIHYTHASKAPRAHLAVGKKPSKPSSLC